MTSPRDIVPQDVSCPWGAFAPPDLQHCEANLCGWITTPANAWSNVAYLLAAGWLLRRGGPLDRWFGWVAVGVGLTSFALHATFTWWGQYADYLGMYLYVGLLLVLNLRRLGAPRWREAFAAVVGVAVVLTPAFRRMGVGLQWIVVSLIAGVLVTEALSFARGARPDYRPWLAGVAITLVGVALWLLDYHRVFCRPENHMLQLHALWHCLTAASIPFVAVFYGRIFE